MVLFIEGARCKWLRLQPYTIGIGRTAYIYRYGNLVYIYHIYTVIRLEYRVVARVSVRCVFASSQWEGWPRTGCCLSTPSRARLQLSFVPLMSCVNLNKCVSIWRMYAQHVSGISFARDVNNLHENLNLWAASGAMSGITGWVLMVEEVKKF